MDSSSSSLSATHSNLAVPIQNVPGYNIGAVYPNPSINSKDIPGSQIESPPKKIDIPVGSFRVDVSTSGRNKCFSGHPCSGKFKFKLCHTFIFEVVLCLMQENSFG